MMVQHYRVVAMSEALRSLGTVFTRVRTIAPSGARKSRHFSRTFDGITLAAAMLDTASRRPSLRARVPAAASPATVTSTRATRESVLYRGLTFHIVLLIVFLNVRKNLSTYYVRVKLCVKSCNWTNQIKQN